MIIPDIHLIFDLIFDLILFNFTFNFHIGTTPRHAFDPAHSPVQVSGLYEPPHFHILPNREGAARRREAIHRGPRRRRCRADPDQVLRFDSLDLRISFVIYITKVNLRCEQLC